MATYVLHQSVRLAQNSNYPLNLLRCYKKSFYPPIYPSSDRFMSWGVQESKPAQRQEGVVASGPSQEKTPHLHLGHITSQTNIQGAEKAEKI